MSRRLEESLRLSLKQLPKADINSVIDADIIKSERYDYITRQEYIARRGVFAGALVTAAVSAAIIIGICVCVLQNRSTSAMVTLDMNAGFIITANSKGEILKVKGIDNAALNILRDLDYTGAGVAEVTGKLVSMSAEQGYLSYSDPCILISVWDENGDNARNLMNGVIGEVDTAARNADVSPEVLGQYLNLGGNLEQDSERMGVTAGRKQLMDAVLKYKPSYTMDQLTRYNLQNLLKIANAAGIPLPLSGYQTANIDTGIGQ